MGHPRLHLSVRTVMAYEIALLMFTHNFNRAAWVASPPQSIADFTSTTTRLTGLMFSQLLGRLVEHQEISEVLAGIAPPDFELSRDVNRVCEAFLILAPSMVISMWPELKDENNPKTEITAEDLEKIASVS